MGAGEKGEAKRRVKKAGVGRELPEGRSEPAAKRRDRDGELHEVTKTAERLKRDKTEMPVHKKGHTSENVRSLPVMAFQIKGR